MRKTSLLAAIFLLCATWAVAQQAPTSQPPAQPQSAGAENQITLEGCLASSSGGGFTLTETSGNSIQLAGASSQLSDNLGKQVRVTGTQGSDSTPSSTSPDKGGAAQTVVVSKVEKVADTCNAAKK